MEDIAEHPVVDIINIRLIVFFDSGNVFKEILEWAADICIDGSR